jgi:hypothetical protein
MPAKKSAAKAKGKAKELVRVVDNESPTTSIEAVEGENQSDIRMDIEEKKSCLLVFKRNSQIYF